MRRAILLFSAILLFAAPTYAQTRVRPDPYALDPPIIRNPSNPGPSGPPQSSPTPTYPAPLRDVRPLPYPEYPSFRDGNPRR